MEEYHEHDQVFSKIDFPHLQQNEDHQNRGSPIKVKIEFRYTIKEERKLAIKKMLEGFHVGDVGDDKGDCAVCLEGFSERKYRLCLPCLHVFHENCIVSWLLESTSCPLCRFEISL
ncbi:hypothetical protein UlMin_041407 [Ulmus minor]